MNTNYDTHPRHASSDRRAVERNPPLFKADSANLAVSASKDGKLRVVYGGWHDAKVVLGEPSTDPAWRPQSDRPTPALPVTSGERGAYPPHRYASREVLLGPVDEA
jgi:hypothetical protein